MPPSAPSSSESVMAKGGLHRFRLYVAGEAHNSSVALANLTAICEASIHGQFRIEVIDVFEEPGRTLADGIFMTPTLVRIEPAPRRTVIGTLSDAGIVMREMGLVALAT